MKRALNVAPLLFATLAFLSAPSHAADTRAYTANRSLPKVDGVLASTNVKTDVVDTQTAAGTASEATFKIPAPVHGPLHDWISLALTGMAAPKAIEIVSVDASYNAVSAQTFPSASIQEIDFPAFDGSSRDVGQITMKLARTSSTKVADTTHYTLPAAKTKEIKANNFSFRLDGLDLSRTTKLGALAVQLAPAPPKSAERPATQRPEGSVAVHRGRPASQLVTPGTLVATLQIGGPGAAAYAQLQQWLSSGASPKNGAIVMFDDMLQNAVCTVTITRVAVSRITADSQTGRATVEMTVGGVGFSCLQ